jgi:hypothetical protein
MRTERPSGRSVEKLLGRLSAATSDIWASQAVTAAVARASTLTAFSNFPLGLLRLPGDTAPLAARIPVTYRPIVPLTRAVQMELSSLPSVDLSGGARVLIAECIPATDPVGRLSRVGFEAIRDNRHLADGGLAITLVETLSVEALRAAISTHLPDILVISAHGKLSPNGLVAGLSIGDRTVLGGIGPLPPLVILSACHVAPRGAGAVSVADLLLREGAFAVLGTQVPVNVRRNAMLTVRFLANLAVAIGGDDSYGDNLLSVWRHVQAGNAVLDILDGNRRLREWGFGAGPGGRSVVEEFMRVTSADRLSRGDIYRDTEAVLGDMADKMDMGDKVRNWFRNPGYVPESIFYAFNGLPERILVRPVAP